jgi:hypothetical protein
MILFDEPTHTYTNEDGEIVTSVTTILRAMGFGGYYKDNGAKERGTEIHNALEIELTTPGGYEGDNRYVQSCLNRLQEFRLASGLIVIEAESLVYSRSYNYAGKFDVLFEDRRRERFLCDFKTGVSVAPETKLQLALYDIASGAGIYRKPYGRMALHLTDKKCKPVNYLEKGDYAIAIALVKKYHENMSKYSSRLERN